MIDEVKEILYYMVGGRKKRDKKPTSFFGNSFEFEGNDIYGESIIYYSDISKDVEVGIMSIKNLENSQIVEFQETINYKDFESLYFEIESN